MDNMLAWLRASWTCQLRHSDYSRNMYQYISYRTTARLKDRIKSIIRHKAPRVCQNYKCSQCFLAKHCFGSILGFALLAQQRESSPQMKSLLGHPSLNFDPLIQPRSSHAVRFPGLIDNSSRLALSITQIWHFTLTCFGFYK